MDQDSFRQFIVAPRFAASSSSAPNSTAAGVLGGATPRRGYQPPPKKDPLKKPVESASKDVFKSKKQKKLEGKYMDRAAQRRAGLEDEYSEVLQVKDEFERRLAEEAEDAAEMEEKRKYLGGDAEHSILVKGLDYALLAKNRAELDGTDGMDDDDELEAAYLRSTSTSQPTVEDESSPIETKKRTREEILAAVQGKKRARATGGRVEATVEPVVEKLSNSKFKPIGLKESKSSKSTKEGAAGGEKKLKKKKKKVAPLEEGASGSMGPPSLPASSTPLEGGAAPSSTSDVKVESSSSAAVPVASSSTPSILTASPLPTPTTAPVPKPKAMAKPLIAAPLDDDDDDIFGGVGDYEGPGDSDSNSDDDQPSASSTRPLPLADNATGDPVPIKRTNWFSATGAVSPSPSPPKSVIPLPTRPDRAEGSRSPSRSRSPSPSAPSTMGRLVPLSGSSMPSVSELLRRDAVNTEMAIRKEKKRQWRMKQGLPAQADGEDDDEEKIEIDWDAENAKGKKEWKGKGKGKGGKSKEEEDEQRAQRDLREYEKYEKKKAGAK